MSALTIVVAAIIAGAFMALASEIGYRLGVLKSNLIVIDGQFAIERLRWTQGTTTIYVLGIVIHLMTSAVFGVIYYAIISLFDLSATATYVIAPYVVFLWLAMLFVALPISGQGIGGQKIGRFSWIEQLFFHAIFGIVFWWMLDTL
jgi:hypothetical protein